MSRRIHYIDWLRVLAVLLLFPFHSGRVFNAGELFYSKSPVTSLGISFFIGFVDRWHMPLLFLLAGAATFFALKKRTGGQYVLERAKRLAVPLLFGTLVLVPPQTWLGSRTNAGYIGSLWAYLSSGAFLSTANILGRGDYFGGISPAHLWFIMFLWLLSMVALPLLLWGRTESGSRALGGLARGLAKPYVWPLVVLAIWIFEGLPDVGGKNPFYFLLFFVLGYVVMHDDAFAASAERWRWWALGTGVLVTALTTALSSVRDSLPDPSFALTLWNLAAFGAGWLVVVGLLGLGRRMLDRPSPALSYLSEASYPVYILHQTVIVVIGAYLVRAVPQPWLGWPLLIALSAAVTFGLYELVRRTPVTRFLFGMRPAPRAAPAETELVEG